MPTVYTVGEILDELCDLFGVYGAHEHGKECPDDPRKMCRMCFVSLFSDRIKTAAKSDERDEWRECAAGLLQRLHDTAHHGGSIQFCKVEPCASMMQTFRLAKA